MDRKQNATYVLTTEQAVAAIAGERCYQRRRWGMRQADGSMVEPAHSIEDFILYMEDYMDEARKIMSRGDEPECVPQALDVLRKVVTMGIAMFEQHGVVARDLSKPIINGRDKQPA